MGRLTLNMPLSFAQFEREVTAERIRDTIAALKRKRLWMGGKVALDYQADGRKLKIDDSEVRTVRALPDLYENLQTLRAFKTEADQLGLRSRRRSESNGCASGGRPFDRGHIHHILANLIYAGRIRDREGVFDRQHEAIIDPDRWDALLVQLQDGASKSKQRSSATSVSLLCEKIFDESRDRLPPSHSRTRQAVRRRYYISHRLVA